MPSAKRSDPERFSVRNLFPRKVLSRRDILRLLYLLDKKCRLKSWRMTVVVAGEAVVRRLNRRFHGRDRATDVLAFDLGRALPDGRRRADVVVNAACARRQARRLGVPAKEELARYIVHGVLHLAGFDDATPASRRRMERRQEELLGVWRRCNN